MEAAPADAPATSPSVTSPFGAAPAANPFAPTTKPTAASQPPPAPSSDPKDAGGSDQKFPFSFPFDFTQSAEQRAACANPAAFTADQLRALDLEGSAAITKLGGASPF
eukprot:5697091-Prymnesium_polylepis.1